MLNNVIDALLGDIFNLRAFLVLGFAVITLSLPVPYLILHFRAGEGPDPSLGLKTVLHYSLSVAVFALLFGLTVLAMDLMTLDDMGNRRRSWLNSDQRGGMAVALSGGLFAILHWLLLRQGTDDPERPAPRRVFTAWRLAVHAVVVISAASIAMIVLFQDEPSHASWVSMKRSLATLFVWFPSWFVHLCLLWRHTTRSEKAPVSWDPDTD